MSDEPLRGADPVNGELEVGYNHHFERRWHGYELLGRAVLVLVTAAGLAGLLGSGPYSHRTIEAGGLAVDFEPIARWNTPTQVTVHIRPTDAMATADLRLDSNFVEPMGLQGSVPTGLAEAADGRGFILSVAIAPGAKEALVRLHARPTQMGPIHLAVRLGDAQPLRWTQYVLP